MMHSGRVLKRLKYHCQPHNDFFCPATGDERVHNFYGMVEQVGSTFVECKAVRLCAPSFADAITGRASDTSGHQLLRIYLNHGDHAQD